MWMSKRALPKSLRHRISQHYQEVSLAGNHICYMHMDPSLLSLSQA